MAHTSTQFGYHRQQTEGAINGQQPNYFEDDNSSILDSAILDTDIMSSPDAHLRRESLASNGVLSPAESQGWDQHYGGNTATETTQAELHHPYREEHNGFVRPNPPHVQTFVGQPQPQQWLYDSSSGHCTPTTAGTFVPIEATPFYNGGHGATYPHHGVDSARGSFSQPIPHPPGPPQIFHAASDAHFIPAPQVQTPMSPHCHQDWVAMGQMENEGRTMTKRLRQASPPRTSVDLQRASGIRKKNGRIDIPNERSIQTIDDLLELEQDDAAIKELKQQKRLLRNREAALASRQRKKRHTEELESREKEYSTTMHQLEGQVNNMKLALANHERNQQGLMSTIRELQHQNDVLQDENRHNVLRHTEETSVLRKRIQLLTEQLEVGPAPAMSAAPSSTGFENFNAGMEALNMSGWDDFIHLDDYHTEAPDEFLFGLKPDSILPPPVPPKDTRTPVASASRTTPETATDQPMASGLIFFLLLCGAFVASKPATSRHNDMPDVPDEVRAAAPAVLSNLLSEAAPFSTVTTSRVMQRAPHEPANSARPRANPRTRSKLDQLHHRITSPTKQQEIDKAFALSTAQYASISGADYDLPHEHASSSRQSRQRPDLAETLSRNREEYIQSSRAEVYTRSLLWDRIPAETVRQFRELNKDLHEIEARRHQINEHNGDDDMTYNMKAEP